MCCDKCLVLWKLLFFCLNYKSECLLDSPDNDGSWRIILPSVSCVHPSTQLQITCFKSLAQLLNVAQTPRIGTLTETPELSQFYFWIIQSNHAIIQIVEMNIYC